MKILEEFEELIERREELRHADKTVADFLELDEVNKEIKKFKKNLRSKIAKSDLYGYFEIIDNLL